MKTPLPNVVLLTADSLRADRLGCLGGPPTLSPHLDVLAQSSDIFKHAVSDGPNTPHAFPAIMSGRRALAFNKLGLFECQRTLAEALQCQGYRTIGFNSGNPYVSRHFCYDRGFDVFHDFIDYAIPGPDTGGGHTCAITVPSADLQHYLLTEENARRKMDIEQEFNTRMVEVISDTNTRPLFLWAHYMDSHYPYIPSGCLQQNQGEESFSMAEILNLNQHVRENIAMPPQMLQRTVALYDAAVRQLDARVGELISDLRRLGCYDNTLLIFCADHGEEFFEHGDLQHKSKMYDELLHVPLLIKRPGQTLSRVHESPVSLCRLPATIMNIVQAPECFPGMDLLHQVLPVTVTAAASYGLDGGTPTDDHMMDTAALPKRACVREDFWKLLYDSNNAAPALFNLVEDPGERCNVISERPDIAERLTTIVKDHLNTLELNRWHMRIQHARERVSASLDASL
jgi:uncharacterized sulfatase